MNVLRRLLKDERGVTPVVGVILMVAVTVVMGAVIAGFVYGYVGNTQKGPLLGLTVVDNPTDTNSILLKQTGGESVSQGDWKLSVTQGKDSPTSFIFASQGINDGSGTGAHANGGTINATNADLSVGRTLRIQFTTDTADVQGASVNATAGTGDNQGWYHVVIIHAPSNALLLDSNVQVR